MSISIIIPVYNEEECIERCIEETQKAFHDTDYEIIMVNDGSKDRSHEIMGRLAVQNHQVKYVAYANNKGYSHAIRKGIQLASKEYTSYLDADLQYPSTELRHMYDFAVTNKQVFVLGRPAQKYYELHRRLMSFAYNLLVSKLLDLPVTDANSLKLIKTHTLRELDLRRERGAIELEVLVGIAKRSIPITLFPVRVQERFAGKSKCSLRLIYPTIQTILELRNSGR